ncbi:hypothetical protein BGZ63DRAFT_364976 [Mariannaea sp. PMI_226]|nr:hypothetical protein BGZ63DRAFT_364976 [Mariannaea sp. PMI_226]
MAVDVHSVPVLHITQTALAVVSNRSIETKVVSGAEVEAETETKTETETEIETETQLPGSAIMNMRAYQLEMLDQSLQRNVIVAMDTGSGKTQVAVLRIKAELEKSSYGKLIWFLAPTVSLCEQQYDVIRLQNPSVSIKVLSGDVTDTWSQAPWDAILSGTRIVVSTYQILLDALLHGFVAIEGLALIVIDEAHNCTGNSPVNQIMTKFYHPAKNANKLVPAILGLSASPIIRSQISDVEKLEVTLDAKCVSPTRHREELLKHVSKPELLYREFKPVDDPEHTALMESLHLVYQNIDIKTDPTIRKLAQDTSEQGRMKLRKAILEHDTYTQQQMKSFWIRSKVVLDQLGPWAVDDYISKVIAQALQNAKKSKSAQDPWVDEDKRYLAEVLQKVLPCKIPSGDPQSRGVSEKVTILIKELLTAGDNVVGIIFVKDRATVAVLADLLTKFPAVLQKYRIGTMVGMSSVSGMRKNIYELSHESNFAPLQDFRSGKINLLLATSVLEEGIDVPACNLVVCFEKPDNVKSFIQRRGRARMKQSKLIIIQEWSMRGRTEWEALEMAMKQEYEKEREEISRLTQIESEEPGSLVFEVPTTGARLDLDNAKAYLEHFCRVVSRSEYVDCRPDYVFHRTSEEENSPITATVHLPPLLAPELRQWDSGSGWQSQKNAAKDAAFHAYKGLYKAGLVNENLLPIRNPGSEEPEQVVVETPYFNAWRAVAEAWERNGDKWMHTLRFFDENSKLMDEYHIVLPVHIPQPRPIKVYPEWDVEWRIEISAGVPISHDDAMRLPDHTSTLLAMHFGHRWEVEDRSLVIKVIKPDENITRDRIGAIPFHPAIHPMDMPYLVRDLYNSSSPCDYTGLLPSKPPIEEVQNPFKAYDEAPENVPYLIVKRVTKRADYLHRIAEKPTQGVSDPKPYKWVLPMPWAAVDSIQKRYSYFARMIPSVIHELEVMMTAVQLHEAILEPVGITDMQLVIEAISARHAIEPVNYERLEFLGDSILKFCTIVQISAQQLNWPEGFLSFAKDLAVSNSNLGQACIKGGVSKYILTKIFTGQKWRPPYIDGVLAEEQHPQKPLPSKMLADVIESLIGASYVTDGLSKALKCISLFLTGENKRRMEWYEELEGRRILFDNVAVNVELPPTLRPLEELLGYSFQKKALLIEAVTHASYTPDARSQSLERLEILGDAVLDYIIVTKVFHCKPSMPHHKLHLLKTAMVNGDFLGFVTLKHSLQTTETIINEEGDVEEREASLPLWKFMRHTVPAIGIEQMAISKRYENLRGDLMDAFTKGSNYPWALLARLQPRKFYADLFEAIIGAVWVDSGTFDACEAVLRQFSVMDFLERILKDDVHILHPKEELGLLSGSETVTYHHDAVDTVDGGREHRCTVKVGDCVAAFVEGALNKEEAKTKAAEQVVKMMKECKKGQE